MSLLRSESTGSRPDAGMGPETSRVDGPWVGADASIAALRTERGHLLQFRWLSVVAMMVMALVAFPLLAPAHPAQPLLGVALVLTAVNLALMAGVARWLHVREAAFLQLLIDLLAWAAFLYFGGGVTNPAISLLLPVVAVGARFCPPVTRGRSQRLRWASIRCCGISTIRCNSPMRRRACTGISPACGSVSRWRR